MDDTFFHSTITEVNHTYIINFLQPGSHACTDSKRNST